MAAQCRQAHLTDLSLVSNRIACVVDNPVGRPIRFVQRLTQENHDVIWITLYPRLMEKQQVARLCAPGFATNQADIIILQRPRIGKVGKLSREIRWRKGTEIDPKEPLT